MSKMEEQVKKNSFLLEELLDNLISEHKGKWVTFHNGKYFISDTFKSGYDIGIKKFGYNTGFVLKKLTKEVPTMSDLVTV